MKKMHVTMRIEDMPGRRVEGVEVAEDTQAGPCAFSYDDAFEQVLRMLYGPAGRPARLKASERN